MGIRVGRKSSNEKIIHQEGKQVIKEALKVAAHGSNPFECVGRRPRILPSSWVFAYSENPSAPLSVGSVPRKKCFSLQDGRQLELVVTETLTLIQFFDEIKYYTGCVHFKNYSLRCKEPVFQHHEEVCLSYP